MAPGQRGQKSAVRIIGGQWRGRKLLFHDSPGLRPSPDRVRETLFNWLSADIAGAHCLDLFAGSGALGLEALSRGAASCLMLDSSRQCCADINAHLRTLDAVTGHCITADSIDYLDRGRGDEQEMDIVFLDPPFERGLLQPAVERLEQRDWLASDAKIYVECGRREAPVAAPDNWRLHRDKRAGQVRFQLFVRQG